MNKYHEMWLELKQQMVKQTRRSTPPYTPTQILILMDSIETDVEFGIEMEKGEVKCR